jgi:hypothetical protein
VRLSDDARKRMVALVGERGMALFIRQAVQRELERREQEAAAAVENEGTAPAQVDEDNRGP